MPALLTVLEVLGWIALLVGVLVVVWEFITSRVFSRPGVGMVAVGVVLLVVAYVLSPAVYDALPR